MSPNQPGNGLLPARTTSALGGIRTPNLLIRSQRRGVSAAIGMSANNRLTWAFSTTDRVPVSLRHYPSGVLCAHFVPNVPGSLRLPVG
jgi:hypothetical protein